MNDDLKLPWGASLSGAPPESGLSDRLASLSTQYGPLHILATYRPDPLVAVGRDVVVHLASSAAASTQLRLEQDSRNWAAAASVTVPTCELIESDNGAYSLISQRVPSLAGTDRGYAEAAIRAHHAMQSSPLAPPSGGATWRARRRNKPLRGLRAFFSPLQIGQARALRAVTATLPADGWAHGDFRTYNLLYDSGAQRVNVVDWEYVGRAWRGSDLLALWACTDESQVSAPLLEAVLNDRGPNETAAVGAVLWWACLRLLAEQVTGTPIHRRNHERIARIRGRLARAERIARNLGTVLT